MENKNKLENKLGRILAFTPPRMPPVRSRRYVGNAETHSLVNNLWFDKAQYLNDHWKDMDFE